jgi:SNF2 family DNA or RNA helicase
LNIGSLLIDATAGVRALFPDAPLVDGKIRLAHTPSATIPLRAIGYDVPASIRTTYNWCGGTPFDIQVRTCELMTENPRCYVLNSMGTGKTRCALWAYDYLKKLGLVNKMLVVCPLSTVNFTWAHEIMKATPHLRWSVLYGVADKRRKLLSSVDVDVYIINHDGLGIVGKEVAQRADIDVIVLDELAVYRNNTQRTKIANKVCADKAVVWGMTGAPMPNAVTDIFQQIKIITPHRVPKHFSWLRDELQVRISQFKWLNKTGAIDKAFNYMQPSVRYTLDDIMELPEAVVPPPMETGLSDEQRRIYTSLRKFAPLRWRPKRSTPNAGVLMSKLLRRRRLAYDSAACRARSRWLGTAQRAG